MFLSKRSASSSKILASFAVTPFFRGEREKRLQRSLLQFNHSDKRALVIAALKTAGREDLIGGGEGCLIRTQKNYC
jgi:hypothetical protein